MDTCKLRRCSFSFLLPLLIILVLQIASQQYRKLQQNRYPTFAFFLFLFFLLLIYNDLNYNPVFYTHWQRMVFFYNTLTRVLASLIKYQRSYFNSKTCFEKVSCIFMLYVGLVASNVDVLDYKNYIIFYYIIYDL